MSRRAYLYFVITFLLGITAGGAGFYYYGLQSRHWHHESDQQRIVQRMNADLNLDDSQTQKLSSILDDYFKKKKELEQKHQPEFDTLRLQTRDQIRQVLNPDQLAKFNDHVRKVDEHMKKERAGAK